jgi:hypothetical protein
MKSLQPKLLCFHDHLCGEGDDVRLRKGNSNRIVKMSFLDELVHASRQEGLEVALPTILRESEAELGRSMLCG